MWRAAWPLAATLFATPALAQDAEACGPLVRWLPAVGRSDCQGALLEATEGRSVKGQTIYRRDIAVPEPRVRVLVLGGIHGDERSSSSLVMHWIALAGLDPAAVHWRFIPVLNPDGMFRRQPQRTNARGVDLNRNFPTPNWLHDSRTYWEQRTRKDPRRYPGPSPLSEPESRFLHAEMAAFQPHLIVSVHAPYGVLDFDGPNLEPPRRLGQLHLDPVGVYPGSLGNYSGVHRGMPVVTIELNHATRTPPAAEMGRMWTDLLAWMQAHLPGMAPPLPPPPPLTEPPPAPARAPEPPASAPEPVPPDTPPTTPAGPGPSPGLLAPDLPPPLPSGPEPDTTPDPPTEAPA